MKIFILHHHLKKGGVTRIIGLQVKSLISIGYKKSDIKIVCGSLPEESRIEGIETIIEPELDYLYREDSNDLILHQHLNKLSNILRNIIGKEDIIHVHNYGLGKNPIFTIAISIMINEGYRVLNHCHDFAEDRPANMNYLEAVIKDHFGFRVIDILYPIKKNLIYGVINRSDRERLFESGIPEKDIKYLPNPVDSSEFKSFAQRKSELRNSIHNRLEINPDKIVVTYPVRVIRRKNIEEILLLSILFKDTAIFIVTLPPENPIEIEYYKYWKEFAADNKLPVIFDVGQKIDFRELLAGSDFCISTSIMEGFGMTFLEPWLTDTPVIGRDLPSVTDDFKKIGLIFTSLYKNIKIRNKDIQDFKDLNQKDSTKFLTELISSKLKRDELLMDNPDIETLLTKQKPELIINNKKVITENYSLKIYGNKLNDIYKRLSQ